MFTCGSRRLSLWWIFGKPVLVWQSGSGWRGCFHLRQNLLGILYAVWFARRLNLGIARIPAFAHEEQALFAAPDIGRGHNPRRALGALICRGQKERKVLLMIIAVRGEDIETG